MRKAELGAGDAGGPGRGAAGGADPLEGAWVPTGNAAQHASVWAAQSCSPQAPGAPGPAGGAASAVPQQRDIESIEPVVQTAHPSTLDEPVSATIMRDVKRIGSNLRTVLLPVRLGGSGDRGKVVRDWDLWGPMIFSLLLSISLSIGSKEPGRLFALVFGVAVLGALVLTINVTLLGGKIAFFGSLSLLGYCIFPIAFVAFVCIFVTNVYARGVLLLLAMSWASWAGVPFIAGSVSDKRKGLAVYPLFLIYAFLSWLTLLH